MAIDSIKQAVQDYTARVNLTCEPPEVVVRELTESSTAAQVLVDYARAQEAQLIILTSHGHRGLANMLFGSFAERLLRLSPLPLLLLNHHPTPPGADWKRALFATDFSAYSRTAFQRLLEEGAGLIKEIVLYHDFSAAVELAACAPGLTVDAPENSEVLLQSLTEANSRDAAEWTELGRSRGFHITYLQTQGAGPTAESILEAARAKSAGFVVMASVVGPFSALVLGSHARQLIQAAQFPVLIYGPQACKPRS